MVFKLESGNKQKKDFSYDLSKVLHYKPKLHFIFILESPSLVQDRSPAGRDTLFGGFESRYRFAFLTHKHIQDCALVGCFISFSVIFPNLFHIVNCDVSKQSVL